LIELRFPRLGLVSWIFVLLPAFVAGSEEVDETTLHPLVRSGGLLGPPKSPPHLKVKGDENFPLRENVVATSNSATILV